MKTTGVLVLTMMAAALILSPGAKPAEMDPVDVIEVIETRQASPEELSRALAAEANRQAAKESVDSMTASLEPGLDFRATGRTSELVAATR